MKPSITTHAHAPATYSQIDHLALAHAMQSEHDDAAYEKAQCEQLRKDKAKLEQKLLRAEQQAKLDKDTLSGQLTVAEFQLKKAEAERAACVLVILLIVVAALMTTCGVTA